MNYVNWKNLFIFLFQFNNLQIKLFKRKYNNYNNKIKFSFTNYKDILIQNNFNNLIKFYTEQNNTLNKIYKPLKHLNLKLLAIKEQREANKLTNIMSNFAKYTNNKSKD